MPCLLGCLALAFPRVVILLLALFSDYMSDAYEHWLWPVLGFFFLPFTTLAYALAINANGGVSGLYLIVMVIAVLADLGSFGSGGWFSRKRKR